MYLDGGSGVEASCQQLSSLDGHRCQLPLALQNVSDGVDVRHVGLLLIVHWNFSVPGTTNHSGCKIQEASIILIVHTVLNKNSSLFSAAY